LSVLVICVAILVGPDKKGKAVRNRCGSATVIGFNRSIHYEGDFLRSGFNEFEKFSNTCKSENLSKLKYHDMAAIGLIGKAMLFVIFLIVRGLDSAAHYSTQTNKQFFDSRADFGWNSNSWNYRNIFCGSSYRIGSL
jgi:hypothetical protein